MKMIFCTALRELSLVPGGILVPNPVWMGIQRAPLEGIHLPGARPPLLPCVCVSHAHSPLELHTLGDDGRVRGACPSALGGRERAPGSDIACGTHKPACGADGRQ